MAGLRVPKEHEREKHCTRNTKVKQHPGRNGRLNCGTMRVFDGSGGGGGGGGGVGVDCIECSSVIHLYTYTYCRRGREAVHYFTYQQVE